MKNSLFQILAFVTFVIFLGTPRFLSSLVALPLIAFCIISLYKSEPRKWLSIAILVISGLLWVMPGSSVKTPSYSDTIELREAEEAEYIKNYMEVGDYDLKAEPGEYVHLTGRIKNTGDREISYYKLTARFTDAGSNIINSEYTNSGDLLLPNASDEYEISFKWSKEYKGIKLVVEELSFK